MDYCSEIRDFIDANVEGAVFGEELGFALFSSGAMPGTVITVSYTHLTLPTICSV